MARANPTPWGDCKVAYPIDNPERFFRWHDRTARPLPQGWSLVELDGAGARWVVVFRVECMPTTEDGRTVAALIRRWGR